MRPASAAPAAGSADNLAGTENANIFATVRGSIPNRRATSRRLSPSTYTARRTCPYSSTPFIPRPLPLQAKGHLLPDFYSGATGLSGRFTEGFSLRRLHNYQVRDAWWENKWGPLTTFVGNQIVVWGQSLAFRVGDIVNPADTVGPLASPTSSSRVMPSG